MTASTSFLSLRRFVEERHGAGAFSRVREALAQQHQIEVPTLAAGKWYPTRAFAMGLDVARHLFGPASFHEDFGVAAAEYEIHWSYRFVLRFASPVWMLEQGSRVWRKAHTTGKWTIEGGEGKLCGTLREFGIVHAGYCRSLTGWLGRACEMTGASRVRVWHPECRAAGAEACVFHGEW